MGVKFSQYDHCSVVMKENAHIFETYMSKYLGLKGHDDVCI